MQICKSVSCDKFPCSDVKTECNVVPGVNVQPEKISIVMVSESAPSKPEDYFYAKENPLFQRAFPSYPQAGPSFFIEKSNRVTNSVKTARAHRPKIRLGVGKLGPMGRLIVSASY